MPFFSCSYSPQSYTCVILTPLHPVLYNNVFKLTKKKVQNFRGVL